MTPFVWSVIYVALLGVLSHIIGQALPRRWFNADRFPFSSFRWEQGGRIYETWFGIRAWKDKMPDMSRVMKDMLPKRLPQGAGEQDIGALVLRAVWPSLSTWCFACSPRNLHLLGQS